MSTASARLPRSSSLERSCSASTSAASSDSLGPGALSTGAGASAPLAVAWPSPFPAQLLRLLAPRPRLVRPQPHWAAPFALSWSSRKRCWRRTDSSCESSFFRPQPLSAGLPRRPSCPASSRPAQAVEVRLRKAGLRVWGLEFAVYRVYRLPASGFRFGSACHPGRSHSTHARQRPRQAQEPSGPQPQYAPARKPGRSHLGRSPVRSRPQAKPAGAGSHLGRSRSTLPDRPAYSISSAPSGPQPQYARKTHARKPNPIRHFQGRINRTAAASPSPPSWRLGMAKLQALR